MLLSSGWFTAAASPDYGRSARSCHGPALPQFGEKAAQLWYQHWIEGEKQTKGHFSQAYAQCAATQVCDIA
jgi:hypothetical protein